MALGNRNSKGPGKPAKKSGGKRESAYRSIGGLWVSDEYFYDEAKQEPQLSISINNEFSGELYFKDKETDAFYLVQRIGLYKPKRKSGNIPARLGYDLAINLNSEKDVALVDENAGSEEASEE